MKSSSQLFDLIKSLNKSEKRYFKLYSGRQDNIYLRLFNAVDSLKTYDEKKFAAKYAGEKFTRNLAYNKNYLYNLVLNVMRDMHAESSPVNSLLNLLAESLFLSRKGLYSQSNKIIDKAVKAACKYENHEMLLVLYIHRLNNIISMGRPVEQDPVTDKIFTEQTELLKLISNRYDYNRLHREFFIVFKRLGTARNSEDIEKFRKIMSSELYSSGEKALSFDARVKFYYDNVLYNYQTGDLEKALGIAVKYLDYIESKPVMTELNFQHYYAALDNVLTLSRLMKQKPSFESALEKFRSLPVDEFRKTGLLYEELQWSVDGLELSRAENVLNKLVDLYQLNRVIIDVKDPYMWSYVCFTAAVLNILTEKFEEALKWINLIRSLDEKHINVLYSVLSKIINMIIHLELKNYEVLDSQVRSAYRFLAKIKTENKFEKIFLNYLKKQLRAKTQKETFELFGLFLNELKILKKDKYESRVFKSFDLISWLESKIKGVPMIEILRQKVNSELSSGQYG